METLYEECRPDYMSEHWVKQPRPIYRRSIGGDRYYWFRNAQGKIQGSPSVTTVLGVFNKTMLEKWKVEKGFEYFTILDHLANYGTLFHHIAFLPWSQPETWKMLSYRQARETYIREFVTRVCPHVEPTKAYIDSSTKGNWFAQVDDDLVCWLKFIKEYEVEPLACELSLASERIGIAGTLDMPCMMNFNRKRVMAIVDIKTSRSGFFEDHGIQLNICRELLIDNFHIEGFEPQEIMLFNWRPSGEFGERKNWTDDESVKRKSALMPKIAEAWFTPKDKEIVRLKEGFDWQSDFTETTTTMTQLEKLFAKETII